MVTVLPTSEENPQTWRYTLDEPEAAWRRPDFKDRKWKKGLGVFGAQSTPNAAVGTVWDTEHIWIRRTFEWPEGLEGTPMLRVRHDEDAEIYINGERASAPRGYVNRYVLMKIRDQAIATLNPGEGTLAVHCRQTKGGQCIDVGLVVAREQREK